MIKKIITVLIIYLLPSLTIAQLNIENILDKLTEAEIKYFKSIDPEFLNSQSLINFAKYERNKLIYKKISTSSKYDFKIIEGYSDVTGKLYGLLLTKNNIYEYYSIPFRGKSKSCIRKLKPKNKPKYIPNHIFNAIEKWDIEKIKMKKNELSSVHGGLYFIAINVNLNTNFSFIDFYEYK